MLPDSTGRQLGAVGQYWDIYARNLTVTGSINGGAGQQNAAYQNATPNVDTLNLSANSGDGGGMLPRFRLTNPSGAQPQAMFKNCRVVYGGVNVSDSLICSEFHYCGPSDTDPYVRFHRRGDTTNPILDITSLGEIKCFSIGQNINPFQIFVPGESLPRTFFDFVGGLGFSGGGGSDVGISRAGVGFLSIDNRAGGFGNLNLNFAHFSATSGPPFQVDSNAQVANLNASLLKGSDWSNPPTIGAVNNPEIHGGQFFCSQWMNFNVPNGTPPMFVTSQTPVANLTVQNASDLMISSSVRVDGSGFKHKRFQLASVPAGATQNIVIAFNTPFSDGSYTCSAIVFDPYNSGTAVAGVRVLRVTQKAAASVTILITNDDNTNAHTTAWIEIICVHGQA